MGFAPWLEDWIFEIWTPLFLIAWASPSIGHAASFTRRSFLLACFCFFDLLPVCPFLRTFVFQTLAKPSLWSFPSFFVRPRAGRAGAGHVGADRHRSSVMSRLRWAIILRPCWAVLTYVGAMLANLRARLNPAYVSSQILNKADWCVSLCCVSLCASLWCACPSSRVCLKKEPRQIGANYFFPSPLTMTAHMFWRSIITTKSNRDPTLGGRRRSGAMQRLK